MIKEMKNQFALLFSDLFGNFNDLNDSYFCKLHLFGHEVIYCKLENLHRRHPFNRLFIMARCLRSFDGKTNFRKIQFVNKKAIFKIDILDKNGLLNEFQDLYGRTTESRNTPASLDYEEDVEDDVPF